MTIAWFVALGLLLLGIVYVFINSGRRSSGAKLMAWKVTVRRAFLAFVRAVVLVALPPFFLPAKDWVGRSVGLIKFGNIAAGILGPVVWLFNRANSK